MWIDSVQFCMSKFTLYSLSMTVSVQALRHNAFSHISPFIFMMYVVKAPVSHRRAYFHLTFSISHVPYMVQNFQLFGYLIYLLIARAYSFHMSKSIGTLSPCRKDHAVGKSLTAFVRTSCLSIMSYSGLCAFARIKSPKFIYICLFYIVQCPPCSLHFPVLRGNVECHKRCMSLKSTTATATLRLLNSCCGPYNEFKLRVL